MRISFGFSLAFSLLQLLPEEWNEGTAEAMSIDPIFTLSRQCA